MIKKIPILRYIFLFTLIIFSNNLIAQCPNNADFVNIQFPTTDISISVGDSQFFFAQVFEIGITEPQNNQGTGIEAWIGYNTENTNPDTWTNWVVEDYNVSAGSTAGNNDEYQVDLGLEINNSGTYYVASRFRVDGCDFTYGGIGGFWSDDSVKLTIDHVDFCNVDFPKNGNINVGDSFTVFTKAFEPGVTDSPGQGANLEAWIGYNQISENYLPNNINNWTWIPATYNSDQVDDDQYEAEIGSVLPAGTYYFASRWRLNSGDFTYGGIQADFTGNFWDFTNNSGTLLVGNPTTLSAGDIAITGFNSDDPDEFSFVILRSINAGTQIRFTDNGWRQALDEFRNNEGTLVWTATEDLECGTEVVITDLNNPFTASLGTVTDDGDFELAADGDQIFAYQSGTSRRGTSPIFIYGINFDSDGWAADATSANNTSLPSALTDGDDAVNLGEIDNAQYNCSTGFGATAILAAVSTDTNWNEDDGTRYTLGTCSYSCAVCTSTTTWDGTSWSPTSPDEDTAVILTGDYTVGGTGQPSFTSCSLTIDSGAQLTINDGFYVEVLTDVTVNDDGDTNTDEIVTETQGSFIQRGNGTVAGTFTLNTDATTVVNKTTSDLAYWYSLTYWSSPVSGESTDGALFDSSRVFWFNASNYEDLDGDGLDDDTDAWKREQGDFPMTPGQGFAGSHNEIGYLGLRGYDYIFSGAYNTGDITYPVINNPANGLHWNLIGNPYPSAIDVDAFFTENGTVSPGNNTVYEVLYMWSQVNPVSESNPGNEVLNYNQNDYITINAIGEAGNGTTSAPLRQIPSGQAFFIPSASSGNVLFTNSMRVSGDGVNTAFYRSSETQSVSNTIEKLNINLSSDIGIYSQISVAYADFATDGDDGNAIDTYRNYAGNAGVLYSLDTEGNGFYVIQGKAKSSLTEDEVIKLGFGAYITTNESYTLEIVKREGDFLSSNPIYIKDNELNITHELSTSSYTFTSDGGSFDERFEIVFNNEALSIDDNTLAENGLAIVELNDGDVEFSIKNNIHTIEAVQIYDLQGRLIYDLEGQNSSTEVFNLSKLATQVYITKVTLSNGQIISKKAIKK